MSTKTPSSSADADKEYMDEYEDYNINQDKYVTSGHSGKGRSKKEAEQHHKDDPSGHTRKIVNTFTNNANNQKK
ncbi:hypothetical protein DPMN_013576 [Dreissena polymorpha]|uniref:Nuclear protein 1 n=1 Tax=Dreissena polymorpha TaxID=45954 RepID=A0A9D4N988_DREPO|nr:hypothetical protein DPMN_013535 [Dreissena polymorpha]KAH3889519.1 hypothetical protein DPMN_013576 [Dreissena polymorpha]